MSRPAAAPAPRTRELAPVRDQYEGRRMARLMSFILAVFVDQAGDSCKT